MASSYAEWKREVSELDALISKIGASVLQVRKLEGIAELEDKLVLSPPRNGEVTPDLEDIVDQLSIKHFGITNEDTQFKYPDGFEDMVEGMAEWWSVQSRADDHEERFSTSLMTDDEAVLALLVWGVDFRDDRGDPLRCTKLLCRQVEAAALKIMGHVPEADEVGLKNLAIRLERDARLHFARKRMIR
ncbi:hypothetical protein [Rhizobium leguminosarum]|uniref:hypothetical protein n=1 Tax=Rhizobium leguminosarum TaxID=384 RepID=UPI001C969AA4|nr:hypothetical protein [Rhizobium leguminosarum]MBY5406506.1 hypothetical protein [Rhizobium leguminosarum]